MLILLCVFIVEGLFFFIISQFSGGFYTNIDTISTLIVAINTIIFTIVIVKHTKNKSEYMILFFAYVIRIAVLYWDIYGRGIFVLPSSGLDSELFHNNAVAFANGLGAARGGMYSELVGYIYKLFGEQRILAQYFNIILSIYTIVIIKDIIEYLVTDKKLRYYMLATVSFLPNFIIMSSILLRESIIIFFIALSLSFFIKWWKSGSLFMFTISLILTLMAALFHSGSIAPAIAYVLCYIFYSPKKEKYSINIKTVGVAIIFVLLYLAVDTIFGDVLFTRFEGFESVEDVTGNTAGRVSGGAAYLVNMQPDSLLSVILYTPIRMFYFLVSPLPWDWRGFNDIFGFVFNATFYMLSLFYVFRALRIKNDSRNLIIALLIMAICCTLMFAWGVSNAGTALRHRDKFLGIYAVMLAVSINSLQVRKLNRNIESG